MKGADALNLLQQFRIQGQRFVQSPLQLPVLKVRGEGHILEGEHEQVARLIAHGQAATTVREAGEAEYIKIKEKRAMGLSRANQKVV